jgi:chromosome segregation protein
MRLKHLELQGFKTFASKSEFVFPTGVTAIVGPNGSGKSNVADALRWVLGEQAFSVLRAKKSEDLIFAGGSGRPRSGMAEAFLTLDNSDGFFPIDFNEVVIGRRAYRDGDNEYLLNGSKVRLREINELLAKTGLARRTYTVIGQGLVDQALSLNSEERRALFEEAAGISLYRGKREDALRKLDETRRNLDRVRDILAEIGPRVRQLERQAQRTRDCARLSTELQAMQRTWFGYHWGQGQATLSEARSAAEVRNGQLITRRAENADFSRRIENVRHRQSELRSRVNEWQRASNHLRSQAEAVQRQLAVFEERARSLQNQIDQTTADRTSLEAGLAAQANRVAQAEADLAEVVARRDTQAAAIAAAQTALNARQAERQTLQHARTAAQDAIQKTQSALTDRRNRRVQLTERRHTLETETGTHQRAIAAETQRLTAVDAERAALSQQLAQLETQHTDLAQHLDALNAELAAARQQAVQRATELNEARANETRRRDRYSVLSEVRASLSGFDAGTRTVINAQLPGVRGLLATLIDVDPEWERAIEAALGFDIQTIVVESWSAAQAARDLLGDNNGRTSLLPLDLLDAALPATPTEPPPSSVPSTMPGCLPWGALLRGREKTIEPALPAGLRFAVECVTCEPALQAAIQHLLANVIVVDAHTLDDVQRLRAQLPAGYHIATRRGEVLHANGVITLGRAAGSSDLLSREREWRGLPAQIDQAAAHTTTAGERHQAALKSIETLTERHSALIAQTRSAAASIAAVETQRHSVDRQIEDVQRALDWKRGLIAQIDAELTTLDERDAALQAEERHLHDDLAAYLERTAQLDAQLTQLPLDELTAHVTALQAEASVAEQLRRGQANVVASYTAALDQLRAQLTGRANRLTQIVAEREAIEAQLVDLRARAGGLAAQVATLTTQIEPAEAALHELEADQNRLETDERAARQRLSELETLYNQAVIDVARKEEELNHLHARIDEELGLVQLEMADLSGPQPLPLTPIVSELPIVAALPDGMEQDLQRLKAQIRRLGPINPEAQTEYEETHQRFEFLTQQSSDLEEAILQLQQVIVELDELMQTSFRETFNAIAEEFKGVFQLLFGGGSAKLVLTDPDNLGQTGIEVNARPPGKKQQGLALLSGGERSLTAAALMFAILKVKPPPFCILDETDAALDEANVGRFRDALKSLSTGTQFVIITHNRGTIEAADTLYGISMGSDSASRAISLKLDSVAQTG